MYETNTELFFFIKVRYLKQNDVTSHIFLLFATVTPNSDLLIHKRLTSSWKNTDLPV